MRKTIVQFACDQCGKDLTRIKNGSDRDFPWDEGWIDLNAAEFGAPKKATHRLIDQPHRVQMENRDFCGKRCFLEFFARALDEASQLNTMTHDEQKFHQAVEETPDFDDDGYDEAEYYAQQEQQAEENRLVNDELNRLNEPKIEVATPNPHPTIQRPPRPEPPKQEERVEEVTPPRRRRGFFG